MQDRPNRSEILTTLENFLKALVPELDGGLAYQLRVAVNLVAILKREEALSEDHVNRERILINKLIGASDDESVRALNQRFCAAILAGDLDQSSTAVIAALQTITSDKLQIVRPGYDKLPTL